MSQPTTTKRKNGRGSAPACPHGAECETALRQGDLLAQVSELGQQLQRHSETVGEALETLALSISEIRERQTVSDQREAEWLRTLGEITRSVAALGGRDA